MSRFLDLLDDLTPYEDESIPLSVPMMSINDMLARLTATTCIRFKAGRAGRISRFWLCRRDAEAALLAAWPTTPGAETLTALARLDHAVFVDRTAFVRRTPTGGAMWCACLPTTPIPDEQFQAVPLYQRRLLAVL